MDYLREALNHGYANYEELTTDTNLSVYRDDPEFQAIAKQILARDPTRK
jgi:hypothetical protein